MKLKAILFLAIFFFLPIVSADYDSCELTNDYCTNSMGAWGAPSKGDNPGNLLNDYFDHVFPEGLVVGIGYNLTFTSASAVQEFLPEGGQPKYLIQSYEDPDLPRSSLGNLAGQVTALKINVFMSEVSYKNLGEPQNISALIIDSGKFEGLTVSEFLELAEKYFGGDASVLNSYDASGSDVASTADSINNNFVDCEVNNNFLRKACVKKLDCVSAIKKGYLHGDIETNKITIYNDWKTPFDVGLAVYKKYDFYRNWESQVLYDYELAIVQPGESVTLTVDLPYCNYQIDAFCGELLPNLSSGNLYGNRKIDWEHSWKGPPYCVDNLTCAEAVEQDFLNAYIDESIINITNGVGETYEVGVVITKYYKNFETTKKSFHTIYEGLTTIPYEAPDCKYSVDVYCSEDEECDKDSKLGQYDSMKLPFCEEEIEDPLIIKAYKVVCEDESYLPNWGLRGGNKPNMINSQVVNDFVDQNSPYCWLEKDWDFQYGFGVSSIPGDFIGYAGNGWKNFSSKTTLTEPAKVEIDSLVQGSVLWVREVLKKGYIPFVSPPGNLQDKGGAEFYCHVDILHFDNYDRVDRPKLGETYYCVAFNVPEEKEPTLGSLKVCKELFDESDYLVTGEGLSVNFTIPLTSLQDAVFETPLNYKDGLDCVSYDDLELGVYEFGEEIIQSDDLLVDWFDVTYSLDNFVIQLTEESPNKTLIVTNKFKLLDLPKCTYLNISKPVHFTDNVTFVDSATVLNISIDTEDEFCFFGDHQFRFEQVPLEACYNIDVCSQQDLNSSWSDASEFQFGEEGCYAVEHFSFFNEGNSSVTRECLIMDKTPPVLNKTVHSPKTLFSGENPGFYPEAEELCWNDGDGVECWTVTLNTPVTVQCSDVGDFQSGFNRVEMKISWDGDDVTSKYCEEYSGNLVGDVCVFYEDFNFTFLEESWHELELTCFDNVNKSFNNIQYYKVQGNTFTLNFNKKWSLFSIPMHLTDHSLDYIFADTSEISSVWYYDSFNETWKVWSPGAPSNLEKLEVGKGYWALSTGDFEIVLHGKSGIFVPGQQPIAKGWNLVGYYGTEGLLEMQGPVGFGKNVTCNFATLYDNVFDNPLSSLYTYWEPFNPNSLIPLSRTGRLDPGMGYWLFATKEGLYGPSSC